MSAAPLALFVYNRPDHTRRTVEALAANTRARETPLFIFSDAPKNDAAREKVEAVRTYIRTLPQQGQFAEVSIREAAENRGLKASIIAGVSEIVEAHGRVITLEDDLLTAPDFLAFMNDALDFYEADPSVGSIAGYCPLRTPPAGYAHDVYAVPRSSSHGWATWADRWRSVDWEAKGFDAFWRDPKARAAFDRCGADRSERLQRELARGAQSWSVLFGFSLFQKAQNTIVPVVTRIRNIGDDGSGVHSFEGAALNDALPDRPMPYRLEHIEPDERVMRAFREIYSGGLRTRIARAVRRAGLGGLVQLAKGA